MRVLVPAGSAAVGERVNLDDGEVHHLRVRRAQHGERVEVLDGAGLRGTGCLVRSGRVWAVEVEHADRESRPAELTLAVATGDRDRFFWMVEKAVELGVTTIVPLRVARSAGVATGLRPAQLGRVRRVALEATKQCGAAWAVQVEDFTTLETLARGTARGSRWLGDQSGAPVPGELDQGPVTVAIGPEGGLTDAEREALLGAGFLPLSLGPHTLRFETAAIAAAAAVSVARLRGSHG
jgi:16S rRNA (uracil1498-N3)-methyltransferase